MAGSGMAKADIANSSEDVSEVCDYCGGAPATDDHIKWVCPHFKKTREDTDQVLAKVPLTYLHMAVRCGIAPAMKLDGKSTFWGKEIKDDMDQKVKRLIGEDLTLHKLGEDADETDKRKAALEYIEDPSTHGLNARELMLSKNLAMDRAKTYSSRPERR